MMTEIGSLPQNDIPDVVNAIVQYAVLGLNSTEYFHDFAGDPLCFLLRDSKKTGFAILAPGIYLKTRP